MSHQQFYIQQKALIEKDNQVLILINPQGQIDFPGGRLDESDADDLGAALAREIKEETSLVTTIGAPFMTLAKKISHGPTAGAPAVMIAYRCLYQSGEVTLSEEHEKFTWVDAETYLELDQADEYFQIIKTFFSTRHQ